MDRSEFFCKSFFCKCFGGFDRTKEDGGGEPPVEPGCEAEDNVSKEERHAAAAPEVVGARHGLCGAGHRGGGRVEAWESRGGGSALAGAGSRCAVGVSRLSGCGKGHIR